MPKDISKATEQKKPEAKSRSKASAKAKAPAKPATKAEAKPRRAAPRRPGDDTAKARSKVRAKVRAKTKAKTAARSQAIAMVTPVDNVLVGAAMRSLQASVPAAIAVNTKLADIAHANVSAGLELARDLASAKTPMDAMRLGVSYWFSHMNAVQAQARALQGLSAAWVKTASEPVRAG